MAKQDLTPEEMVAQLTGMIQLLEQAQATGLEGLAALQQTRTDRLLQVETRLAAELGNDHPRVVAVRRARLRANVLRGDLSDTATRAGRLPVLESFEWMVYGHVRTGRGDPVVGVVVRLIDVEGKYEDLLGSTTTDEFGDFALVYHEQTFCDQEDKQPELFLRVEDSGGNELWTSKDPVQCRSGQGEYYMIELGAAQVPGTTDGPQTQESGAKTRARRKRAS